MGIKKYLGLERRRSSRLAVAVEVEFHVWDALKGEARTGNVPGRLTDISLEGACLQSNRTLIEGHHLLLDDDLEGNTPLVISLKSSPEGETWSIQAQVLWYNRSESNRRYQFDVGLKFVALSPDQRQNLTALMESLAASQDEQT
jgi:hypothetical protein